MRLLWGSAANSEANEALANWCAAKAGLQRGFAPPYTTLGVFNDETLIGVAVFHNFQPDRGVVEISGAPSSGRWLTPKVLFETFAFIFEGLRCQLCVMRISERDKRMIALAKRVGFEGHLVPRLRGRDEAQWIFTLTDDDWHNSGFNKGDGSDPQDGAST